MTKYLHSGGNKFEGHSGSKACSACDCTGELLNFHLKTIKSRY